MPAAIGLIWKWIFNYEFGILNAGIGAFGGERIAWLSDKNFVLWAISAVLIWADVSLRMIVFLAGLQAISEIALRGGGDRRRGRNDALFPDHDSAFIADDFLCGFDGDDRRVPDFRFYLFDDLSEQRRSSGSALARIIFLRRGVYPWESRLRFGDYSRSFPDYPDRYRAAAGLAEKMGLSGSVAGGGRWQ